MIRQCLFLAAAIFVRAALVYAEPGVSALQPVGPYASRIEWLYWLIFWVSLVVFAIVMALFARAASRNRTPQQEPAPLVPDSVGRRGATISVAVGVAITVVTLFVILGFSVANGKAITSAKTKQPVTIQVTGNRWWWDVTYPNSQADLTVTTANEIHVPVGQPVVILTSSRDVVHSFWAPNIQGKRDLLPGYQNAFWIQVDQPGRYWGQCSEYCGLQHAHMAFEVVAEPADQFSQWLAQQQKPAVQPDDEITTRGQQVFLTHSCVLCHTIRGTDAGSRVGPDLTHVGARNRIAAGTLQNTSGALAGWISDPQNIKPGTQMPPNPLGADDLQSLVAYLKSLQ
jgi:cytochrome c oxidase subunit II